MKRAIHFSLGLGIMLVTGLLFAATGNAVSAQESTPPAGSMEGTNYPVSLHLGTCDNPVAEPERDLGDAALPGVTDDDDTAEVRGSANAVAVLVSDETVDMTFDEVFGENQYVIAVHQSSEDFGTIVACGEIGGRVADGQLATGLRGVNDSGVSGIAILNEDSSGILGLGDDELNIKVYLIVDGMTMTQSGATSAAGGDDSQIEDGEATVESAVDDVQEGVEDIGDDGGTPVTEE